MKYKLIYSKLFVEDIKKLKKSEPNSLKKIMKLLEELEEHPKIGTGKPEQLRHNRTGEWSRRISRNHRVIYKIEDDLVQVLLISAYGHYQ